MTTTVILLVLTRYGTRNRNKHFFEFSNFLHASLLQFTQVCNLSNFLAGLLVPVFPKVKIARSGITDHFEPYIISLVDSRCQA